MRRPALMRGHAAGRVIVVLALTGATCVAVVVTQQQRPEPALSAPSAPPVAPPPSPDPVVAPAVLPDSLPLSLAIPAIGVQTPLLALGLSSDGTLEVPPPGPDYDKAGWYRHSPTPGALGPAVLAGHIDSAADGPSVFFQLDELRVGDQVQVARVDGSVAVFAVDEVQRFRKAEFPTELVYGNTDHAALRLITCGGPFDRSSGHYLDNIVVLASLLPPGVQTPA